MSKRFLDGMKALAEVIAETDAELSAMDGVCKQCAVDGGFDWPDDTSGFSSGPCHSCGEKMDTTLIPWDELTGGDNA